MKSTIESLFEDYDNLEVYTKTKDLLLTDQGRNFVVDFSQNEAKIAVNLGSTGFQDILRDNHLLGSAQVRWINIWGPHTQTSCIDALAEYYEFSMEYREILKLAPSQYGTEDGPALADRWSKNDIESANGAAYETPLRRIARTEYTNVYTIAEQLVDFQTLDMSKKYTSIGRNRMYHVKNKAERLWSWLLLCNNSTVISIYEDSRPHDATGVYMTAARRHVMALLQGNSLASVNDEEMPFSISARQTQNSYDENGFEASSYLFYNLFDNWDDAYQMIIHNKEQLEMLSKEFLGALDEKHYRPRDYTFLRDLYMLGKQLRSNKRLYQSHKNSIRYILKDRGVHISRPYNVRVVGNMACGRFEQLLERIELLLLSNIDDAIAERDVLHNTLFQITAQLDSAASTRNASLLSKLAVLFLPVSLATSYFSIQIDDLQGVYTSRDYWATFGVIMAISCLAVIFVPSLLMRISESLESRYYTPLMLLQVSARRLFSRRREVATSSV